MKKYGKVVLKGQTENITFPHMAEREPISILIEVFLQISQKKQKYKGKMGNQKRNINGFQIHKKILSLLCN